MRSTEVLSSFCVQQKCLTNTAFNRNTQLIPFPTNTPLFPTPLFVRSLLVLAVVETLQQRDRTRLLHPSNHIVAVVPGIKLPTLNALPADIRLIVNGEHGPTAAKTVIGRSEDDSLYPDLCKRGRAHYARFYCHISRSHHPPQGKQIAIPQHRRVVPVAVQQCRYCHHFGMLGCLRPHVWRIPRTFPVWFVRLCPLAMTFPSFTNTQPMGTSLSENATSAYV